MSDFEEFMDCLSEATKELVENVEEAWDELKVDLREVVTVKYLRPGGVAYCKADGKKYYGILTGTQIISLNTEGEPEYLELEDFLSRHNSDKLKVAGKNRIAVGKHEVDYAARMEVESERYPSTKAFVLHCLGAAGTNSVNEAIEQKLGAFDWLGYDLPNSSEDEEDSKEEDAE